MTPRAAAASLIRHYPLIFFACHRRHVRDPASQKTISSHAASVLDHLDPVETLSVTGLAKHMGVTPSTMSLTLDRLEAKHYVARERDPVDARRVLVRLTADGERIRSASSVLDPDLVNELVSHLSADERRRALDGLALLAQAASSMSHDARRDTRAAARDSNHPVPSERITAGDPS